MQLFLIIKHQVGELQKIWDVCRAHSVDVLRNHFKASPQVCQCPQHSAGCPASPHVYHHLCLESRERCGTGQQEVFGGRAVREVGISPADFRRNARQGCNSLCWSCHIAAMVCWKGFH